MIVVHTKELISDIKDGNQVIEKMQERLIGRYPLEDVKDPTTGEIIVDTNTMITERQQIK